MKYLNTHGEYQSLGLITNRMIVEGIQKGIHKQICVITWIPAFVRKEGRGRGLGFVLAAAGAVALHPTCVCCIHVFYSLYVQKKLPLSK